MAPWSKTEQVEPGNVKGPNPAPVSDRRENEHQATAQLNVMLLRCRARRGEAIGKSGKCLNIKRLSRSTKIVFMSFSALKFFAKYDPVVVGQIQRMWEVFRLYYILHSFPNRIHVSAIHELHDGI